MGVNALHKVIAVTFFIFGLIFGWFSNGIYTWGGKAYQDAFGRQYAPTSIGNSKVWEEVPKQQKAP